MGVPALKIPPETAVEERIARLEANVEHIQSDVSEMKIDLRELRQEIRQDARRFEDKLDLIRSSFEDKIDGIKSSIASAKLWALGLYIAFAAAILGSMATGFLWLAEKL